MRVCILGTDALQMIFNNHQHLSYRGKFLEDSQLLLGGCLEAK